MTREQRLTAGLNALTQLSIVPHRNAVYAAFNVAIQSACEAQQFDVAASLRDLREFLTDDFRPRRTTADELQAMAGL